MCRNSWESVYLIFLQEIRGCTRMEQTDRAIYRTISRSTGRLTSPFFGKVPLQTFWAKNCFFIEIIGGGGEILVESFTRTTKICISIKNQKKLKKLWKDSGKLSTGVKNTPRRNKKVKKNSISLLKTEYRTRQSVGNTYVFSTASIQPMPVKCLIK